MSKATKKKRQKKAVTKEFNLRAFLTNRLRRASYAWPARGQALREARVDRGVYKCAKCGGQNFKSKEVQVDHIEPVIDPHVGFKDWNSFIERLFCDVSGLAVLCVVCHKYKSSMEAALRRQVKSRQDPDDGDI